LRIFQVPGLFIVPLVFALAPPAGLTALGIGVFVAGFFTVAQFSFWGNYLPRVYPLHLRGAGEGFAANICGRRVCTSFFAVTGFLSRYIDAGSVPMNLAYAAAAVGLFVYLVGAIACFWLPEPAEESLPE